MIRLISLMFAWGKQSFVYNASMLYVVEGSDFHAGNSTLDFTCYIIPGNIPSVRFTSTINLHCPPPAL